MNNQQSRTTEVAPPPIGRPVGAGSGPGARFAPGEKAKDAKKTFRNLLKFYFKEAKSLFVVIVLLLAETVITVLVPYYIGKAIDALDKSKNGFVDFSEDMGKLYYPIRLYSYM